jgi:hypothetical protein
MVCYRHASYATPLRTVPASQEGRFNRRGDEPTQYLSEHPLGPLAELMRHADLRSSEQVRMVRTRTWALEVPVDELPEVTFENAGRFDVSAADLVDDDHTACRRLASRLRARLPGVIVPSACLPGTRNIVLFGARVAAPYLTAPLGTVDIPASITAQDGRPLAALLERVCFVGRPHAALRAWQAGSRFRFEEPDWSLAWEAPA